MRSTLRYSSFRDVHVASPMRTRDQVQALLKAKSDFTAAGGVLPEPVKQVLDIEII